MSNSVVPAAAVVHAKQLVVNKKLAKHNVKHQPARDEQPADKDQDEANAVQAQGAQHQVSMSEVSLSGDVSFAHALADAAGSSSLVSEVTFGAAQSDGGYGSDDNGGGGGTLLLIGAVALVGLGIAVLAGGGNKNHPPAFSAATQAVTTDEDTAKAVTVTATDPDNDALTYSVTTAPTKGTVTGGTGGAFTYTPSANFNGSDSFVVTATDPDGATTTQTVNVTVNAVNDAPTVSVATQNLTGTEDTPVTGTTTASDVDAGTTLTYSISTQGKSGAATIDSKGAFTYTPNANANGADSFVVTVSDGKASVNQTVNVTLAAVNDAPTVSAATQTKDTNEDTPVSGSVSAADVDGDTLTYTVSTNGAKGSATIDSKGDFTYTPNANANGTDSFVVTVSDGKASATQTVTVNIAAVNDAPAVAAAQSVKTNEDTSVGGTVSATDVEGDALTYTVSTAAGHGTATIDSKGAFNYAPAANYHGADSFVVTVSDGKASATQTVSVDVAAVNDAPVFNAESIAIDAGKNTKFSGTVAGSATDVDGDTLTFAVGTQAAHGTAVVNADGTYSYTPANNYLGADSFTISVSDGNGGTDALTVNAQVGPVTETVSLDVGNPTGTGASGIPILFDAGTGAFIFTDDASKASNVTIINFGIDDVIHTTNATASDYGYGTAGDPANDLNLTYNNSGAGVVNVILIEDVLGAGFVSNYAQATANVANHFATPGFNFQTFG